MLVLPFGDHRPKLGRDVFVAANATIIGQVDLGDEASVWFGAVVRGDIGPITIGARTNLQDMVCVHITEGLSTTEIGDDVTVGHGAILHGCTIGDGALVGMGAILLDGCKIGEGSVVAAGSVVPPRLVVPPRSLVRGSPAKVVRHVTDAELSMGVTGAAHYVEAAKKYRLIPGAGK